MRHLQKTLAAVCLAALTLTSQAVGSRTEVWTAAADSTLANMRGGFALPSGLNVSFGIVRTVQIDGVVVSHTAFQMTASDLQNMTPQQAKELAQATSMVVVQNGPGNTAQGVDTQAGGLLLQNTRDGAKLQTTTIIDAATNSLGMLRGLNLNQMLNDVSKGALGN